MIIDNLTESARRLDHAKQMRHWSLIPLPDLVAGICWRG